MLISHLLTQATLNLLRHSGVIAPHLPSTPPSTLHLPSTAAPSTPGHPPVSRPPPPRPATLPYYALHLPSTPIFRPRKCLSRLALPPHYRLNEIPSIGDAFGKSTSLFWMLDVKTKKTKHNENQKKHLLRLNQTCYFLCLCLCFFWFGWFFLGGYHTYTYILYIYMS